jgi:hypothetical protein
MRTPACLCSPSAIQKVSVGGGALRSYGDAADGVTRQISPASVAT